MKVKDSRNLLEVPGTQKINDILKNMLFIPVCIIESRGINQSESSAVDVGFVWCALACALICESQYT